MSPPEVRTAVADTSEEIPTALDALLLRIAKRTATVGVMGLGYVGLPLALACAEVFQRAIGFDVNLERIVEVNDDCATQKNFSGTADFALLRDCDVVVICVPTPLEKSKNPDLSYIRDAADRIAAHLRPGQIVILESTSYPGTTDELLLPHFEATGL
ncbi:MAG TPA: NAD(P)-binding domain-containing protein, partial [Candidatus Acidoferrum sp.]|nr:NAD(P)-binding domain-containing protein [Candidatus Acidoferrum sp.]